MQMLPLLEATSVEHREPQCLLTLTRSLKAPPRISSFCVCDHARVLFVYEPSVNCVIIAYLLRRCPKPENTVLRRRGAHIYK